MISEGMNWRQQYLELIKNVEEMQTAIDKERDRYERRIQEIAALLHRPKKRDTAIQNVPDMYPIWTQTNPPPISGRLMSVTASQTEGLLPVCVMEKFTQTKDFRVRGIPQATQTKDSLPVCVMERFTQTKDSQVGDMQQIARTEASLSARVMQQTVIDACGLQGLPSWAILPVSEIEKLYNERKDRAAVWRAWWGRIVSGIGAFKMGDDWEKTWTLPISRIAESASKYQPRQSRQITNIMEACWRGDKKLSYSREEVDSLFKDFPVIAAACWFYDKSKPLFKAYQEFCDNILVLVPLAVYEQQVAGYTLDILITKSIQAKNQTEALSNLYMKYQISSTPDQQQIAKAMEKDPKVQEAWAAVIAFHTLKARAQATQMMEAFSFSRSRF